ncbi:uncharacterized protein LOC143179783 [Calliopsis andreniformis]|uniref:uncharacterized protein LOC143179783 n=1 Tax=Calliopsis andreniformis TaxID=337506 RepID=UPI003FCC9DA0
MTTIDPILTCPYDKVHRIRKSVLPYHLVRCGKNNTSSGKLHCPFDVFHLVDEIYLESHIENCASSGNIKSSQYDLEPEYEVGTVPLEVVKNLTVPVMTDWNEEYTKPYDPWESTKDRNITRCVIGGSKSFKKKFKLAERKRIKELERKKVVASNRTKCMKHEMQEKYVNVSSLVHKMSRLYLEDFDTLLQSIDFSKLCITDINKTFSKEKCTSEIIEKVLVQKFKKLLLYHLHKQSS